MTKYVFREDIEQVALNENIPWRDMLGASVLITGATGFIGSALVRSLIAASMKHNLGLRIIGTGRNIEKGRALIELYGMDVFIENDIRQPFSNDKLPYSIDYIFHCASITQSIDMVSKPVDVITTAVDGTRNMLELARIKQCKSFVYLSSMEVYGQTGLDEVSETDLGYWDLSRYRTSYPESKRLCENLCVAFTGQYGIPVKIARLALTFGAGISQDSSDSRVAVQFAKKAVSGEDIELHTSGNSIINCCYTSDAVLGLLTLLLKGKEGEAYNVANPAAAAKVREMAEVAASVVGDGKVKVIIKIPDDALEYGYAPDNGYTLNVDKLKSLGWQPSYGLADMFRRMVADWVDNSFSCKTAENKI